jgi:hypothetical protein
MENRDLLDAPEQEKSNLLFGSEKKGDDSEG